MSAPRFILVGVAWPYASGPRHLGHIAGAYLPPDIFARYQRLAGNRVLMVSGSDGHGTPITVRADEEGVTPQEIVDRYHAEFLKLWDAFGIEFDLYTTTLTDNHRDVTHDMFLTLLENGFLEKRTTEQFFDVEAERFLPDRYVQGKCPHCGYEHARGDQCENCGRTLDPEDLKSPRSALTGATPELRATEHYFLLLSKLQDQLAEWLESREGWRKHVQNWSLGFVNEGLHDRAITRDIEWGITVPVDDLGDGKRIYVWFEAVIGYLSASKEWSQHLGEPEAWRLWWENEDAETYYFVGKDNIPFHAVIWTAMLMGYGGLNLPTNVPANAFVTFKGEKASASRGIGASALDYFDDFEPDAIRYALAANLPEHDDTDLSIDEMIRRVNDELVATWGNLVNRVLMLTRKNFENRIPAANDIDREDERMLDAVDDALARTGEHINRVELRAGLRAAMEGASEVNAYLNSREPWKTASTDPARTATTLNLALQAINGLKVAFSPYLPFSTDQLHHLLGQDDNLRAHGWNRVELLPGTPLPEPQPLFRKIET